MGFLLFGQLLLSSPVTPVGQEYGGTTTNPPRIQVAAALPSNPIPDVAADLSLPESCLARGTGRYRGSDATGRQ
jgi:hypothetical protein